ncbi:MAG TPA: recombinase family protein [Bacillota bacterium]|nr:recombinase family protein [Bacillota bacterium]HPW41525.1 recombinase family protein [Bacillota bacterium]
MKVVKGLAALVYLRVSTEEQAERGYSIQVQRDEGLKKAVELGCSPENIYIFNDEGVSGAFLERPQLMAALDMVKNRENNISYFICYDSSRLSRNAAHQLIIVDEIKKSGAKLIFLKNNYQDNAEGRFQLTVMAAVDEYERARLRLRTEMGKRAKAGQHMLTHNPGIYGYDFDQKSDTLSINEDHAKRLKQIFALLIEEHKSPAEIAGELNASGVPSPRMKQWSRVTVRRMLSNPSYLGTLYIRRYDTRECYLNKFKKKGEKIKVKERPRDEWIPVKIPQIIDKDTWEKAQDILKESSRSRVKGFREDFILTPLLKCGMCSSIMNSKAAAKGNSLYRYYICPGKYKGVKGKNCNAALVKADDAEKAIWEQVYKSIYDFAKNEADMEKLIEGYISETGNNIENILREKEKAILEKERIITMFQKGYIKEDEMCRKLKANEKSLIGLNEAAAGRNEKDAAFIERLKKDCREKSFPYIIRDVLNRLDSKDKRYIIRLLISEIIISGNTVIIKGRL